MFVRCSFESETSFAICSGGGSRRTSNGLFMAKVGAGFRPFRFSLQVSPIERAATAGARSKTSSSEIDSIPLLKLKPAEQRSARGILPGNRHWTRVSSLPEGSGKVKHPAPDAFDDPPRSLFIKTSARDSRHAAKSGDPTFSFEMQRH